MESEQDFMQCFLLGCPPSVQLIAGFLACQRTCVELSCLNAFVAFVNDIVIKA
jgi:hypothetical protein